MAFWDKVNDIAKSESEKTSNAIETGKLTLKISTEEKKISAATMKLGELYLAKLDMGEAIEAETAQIYSEIISAREVIAVIQEELDNLKAPKEAPVEQEDAPEAASQTATTKYCSNCGAKLDVNARFCPECGTRQ